MHSGLRFNLDRRAIDRANHRSQYPGLCRSSPGSPQSTLAGNSSVLPHQEGYIFSASFLAAEPAIPPASPASAPFKIERSRPFHFAHDFSLKLDQLA